MMNPKAFFIERILEESSSTDVRVLELACGTARYVPELLREGSKIKEYVGVEPLDSSYDKAVSNIGTHPKVKLFNQFGYTEVPGLEAGSFDVVYSMSALEHIKDLKRFITLAAKYVKPNGLMVHRYDLGHALYPGSLKERFQVFLGSKFPKLLGEHTFVRYVPQKEVEALFTEVSCPPYKVTYHQMPNHKEFGKHVGNSSGLQDAMDELTEWEWKHTSSFVDISLPAREKLFPSVAVWGRKQN